MTVLESLEARLRKAEDDCETAEILFDEADRVREEAIKEVNRCRRVAQLIRQEIIAKEKQHA